MLNSNLTPAAIRAIETAASTQYGIPLRYAPERETAPTRANKPKAMKSPAKKPAAKKPTTKAQHPNPRQFVLDKAKDGPVRNRDIQHLFPDFRDPSEKVRNLLASMVQDGLLTREGKNTGTIYKLKK